VPGYGFDTDYGFVIRITDLRYGFTDLRIYGFFFLRNQKQPERRNERAGTVFCGTDYGFVIRILWIQCTDFMDSVYGFYILRICTDTYGFDTGLDGKPTSRFPSAALGIARYEMSA
jgi:hypothetical protein